MITWVISGAVAVVAAAVVIMAIVRDPVAGSRAVPAPDWDVPHPDELRGVTFPISLQGYDPDVVDTWTAAVADAVAVLTEEAGPDAVARARTRLRQHADGRHGDGRGSGEELEDGGGDGTGVLDR